MVPDHSFSMVLSDNVKFKVEYEFVEEKPDL